ncbi:hypothetical protein LguiA_019155 [Lonicera macranthoides]
MEIPSGSNIISRNNFSKDFIFGSASSAYQNEGAAKEDGKGQSIWDTFTERTPVVVKMEEEQEKRGEEETDHIEIGEKWLQGKVVDGANGNVAADCYHLYKEDVKLLKKIGLDAYRFSISWPRIFPRGKINGGLNKKGVSYYNNFIDELLANGRIEPHVTLFHWDLPQALEDEYGGFLSPQIVVDFCNYAEFCFWEFGDRVKNWITINEPWSLCSGGYVGGTFAPGRGASSPEHITGTIPLGRCTPWQQEKFSNGDPATEPYLAGHYQLLTHAAVVDLYRKKFQTYQEGRIGIALNLEWKEPLDDTNKMDIEAASRSLDFMLGWFLEPLTTGDYPQSMRKLVNTRLPKFSAEQSDKLKKSYDFIGLNYYTANYATSALESSNGTLSYATDSQVTITRVGEANDANSTLSQSRNDSTRILYYQDHLSYIRQAIDDGINVKGYFIWSLLDNFEWNAGYSIRFGMIHVDFKNDLIRYPKDSAIWLMDFLKKRDVNQSTKRRITESNENESSKKTRK